MNYDKLKIIRNQLKITDINQLKITNINQLKITNINQLKITDINQLKIKLNSSVIIKNYDIEKRCKS